jgi:serine protease Do
MNSNGYRYAALLAVVGVSIVFGMVLGGKLNAPQVALAQPDSGPRAVAPTLNLAPAVSGAGSVGFADIVEESLPAVVGVTNLQSGEDEDEEGEGRQSDPFFRWFFGDPEDRDDPRRRFMDRPRQGFGSGFIVSPEGYVLTNHHVVSASDRIRVSMQNGRTYDAKLIGSDPAIDLALIKVDANGPFPTLPMGDSESLRVGQWVIAIGNPLNFEQTVTVGVVSAKHRQLPELDTDISLAQFIQTDAAINFGNSGGPLMDGAGNVIGINTAIRRGNLAEGIGFALPINDARAAMEQLLASGTVQRGFLGITLTGNGLNETAADYYGLPDRNGAIVQAVTRNEPADKAGVKKGDIIRKVDGRVVRDNRDLIRQISSRRPGDSVQLEIFRDGKTLERTAHLIDRSEGAAIRPASNVRPEPEEPEVEASSGLGVRVETLTRSMRESRGLDDEVLGVVVVGVDIDSPLGDSNINILPSAIIFSINDRPTRNVSDWDEVVGSLEPGDAIKVEVLDPGGASSRFVFLRVPND